MKKFRTVVIDGVPKRVPYKSSRVPASDRNAGLLPSRYEVPDTIYKRRPKHRRDYEEDE